MLVEPADKRRKVSLADCAEYVALRLGGGTEQLSRGHSAYGITWEVPKQPARPVDVLQTSVSIIAIRVEAQVCLHLLVP